MSSQKHGIAVVVALGLPWLIPPSFGPTPIVLQWVVTWLLAAFAVVALALLPKQQAVQCAAVGLAWALLVAALLSSLMALAQVAGLAATLDPWVSSSNGLGYANLRQRNHFATLTVFGLVALLYLSRTVPPTYPSPHVGEAEGLRVARMMGGAGRFKALGGLLALALLMAGDAASASRTGLVGVLLVCLLGAGWLLKSKSKSKLIEAPLQWWLLALALPLYAVAVGVGMTITDTTALARIAQGDIVCSSRTTLWANVLTLIGQRPWLGWGWGELAFAHFITLYPGERFCAILDNAHSLPLHFAVSWGVPVALVLSCTLVWLVVRQKPWAEKNETRQMAWCLLAVILLHSLLEHPLWFGPFQVVATVCVLILWDRDWTQFDVKENTEHRSILPVRLVNIGLVASLCIAMLGYMGWDYFRISQMYLLPPQRASAYRADTWNKVKDSWVFQKQMQFAMLMVTPLEPSNAAQLNELAKLTLHFTPEASVAQKLVESAVMLGRDDEALYYLARFQAAFPAEHKVWAEKLNPAPVVPAGGQ